MGTDRVRTFKEIGLRHILQYSVHNLLHFDTDSSPQRIRCCFQCLLFD